MYGWIITKDLIGKGEDVGRGLLCPMAHKAEATDLAATADARQALLKRLQAGEGQEFRLSDDDGEVYYEGRYLEVGDDDGDELSPLHDFGLPNAGCTTIEHLEVVWVISNGFEDDSRRWPQWWSNDDGWVDRASATEFTPAERWDIRVPINGNWVAESHDVWKEL